MLPQSAQAARVASLNARAEHVKVEIKDSGGTFRDVSSYPGYNALNSLTVEETADGPHRTLNLTLKREMFDFSVGGFVAAMRNPAGTTPLIELNREIRVYLSVAPMGSAADYVEVFHGYIDAIDDGAGDTTVVEATDKGARLARCQIEVERCYGYNSPRGARQWAPSTPYVLNEYIIPAGSFVGGTSHYYKVTTAGTSGTAEPTWTTGGGSTTSSGSCVFTEQGTTSTTGIAVEDLIQELLDDNLGTGVVTLEVPSAPSWVIKPYQQQREYLLNAVTTLATQMGWDIRYKWKTGSSSFELTLYEPDRGVSGGPVAEFTAAQYESVSALKRDLTSIRNAIRVIYSDSANPDPNGNLPRKIVDVSDSGSIAAYGRLYMELSEEETSQIDTSAEATDLVNAALADLANPTATFEVSAYLWPWAELGDYYTFDANNRHFSADQNFAVAGYRHEATSNGDGSYKCRTTLTTRGLPALGPRKWIGQMGAGDRFSPDGQGKEKHRIQDMPIVDALTLGASATVGGALFSVSGTMSKLSALVGQELHVSTTPNFTKDSSTLVATGDGRSFEVSNLLPGQAYYASLVPLSKNAGRIVRGLPGPETSFTAGQALSQHISCAVNPAMLPPNGTFEHAYRDLAAYPPDRWNAGAGITWGASADLYYSTDTTYGRTLYLRATASTCQAVSDVFAIRPDSLYRIEVIRKGGGSDAGSVNLNVVVQFWKDSAGSSAASTASHTHAFSTGTGGVFSGSGIIHQQSVPTDGCFASVRIEKASADANLTVEIGQLTIERTDNVQPAHIAPTLTNSWVNYGAPHANAGYYINGETRVFLRGQVKSGTVAVGSTGDIFTLPTGYRPASDLIFATISNNALAQLIVRADGGVNAASGSNTGPWSLDGINFRAA